MARTEFKISVVVGTRPEAIKLAPVILALRKDEAVQCRVCVSAQHRQMLDQVLTVFNIQPDTDLNLMRPKQTLADLTCRALQTLDEYYKTEKPNLVLVQGDTTTVLAGALAAFYNGIPIGHLEAGLRTKNLLAPWPEEANRVLTTHIATLHFAPTVLSRNNLLAEGIGPEMIFVTGNTVIDALYMAMEKVRLTPPLIPELPPHIMNGNSQVPVVLITGHRRESFGEKLASICQAIRQLARQFPTAEFIYPVHLNPNVRNTVTDVLGMVSGTPARNVHLIEPLSYLPFVALMQRATVILTDSGGIQEEAPSIGKPVLVTRQITERPEALDGGTVKLVGSDKETIVREVSRLLTDHDYYQNLARVRTPYGDGKATERILRAIFQHFGFVTSCPAYAS